MTGWMFFFMGIYYKDKIVFFFGLLLTFLSIWCIRTQFLITTKQYVTGMIPHHSMAVLISKKLLQNQQSSELNKFVENIIRTQEEEIDYMKSIESNL
jgi:hypothetical protein